MATGLLDLTVAQAAMVRAQIRDHLRQCRSLKLVGLSCWKRTKHRVHMESRTKALLSLLVAALVIGAAYAAIRVYRPDLLPWMRKELTPEERYGVGAELIDTDPGYARAIQYLNAGNISGSLAELVALRDKYATSTPERNAVEYSVGLVLAFNGEPFRAIEHFKKVILDVESYNPTTRALSTEALGRIYWTYLSPDILGAIFSGDDYFNDLLGNAGGEPVVALYRLIEGGYHIVGTPISAARLAERASSDIISERYSSEEERAELVATFEGYAHEGAAKIAPFANLRGYESYRAEFHSIYGGALQNAVLAGATTHYTNADIEAAYQQAYMLANPGLQPFIIYRYGSFLSVTDPKNTEKIENLSKRLLGFTAQQRANFDSFIGNTLTSKKPDGVYELLSAYRAASPTFDAYAKEVIESRK